MSEFTHKRARQYSRQRIRTIQKSLQEIAAHWGDLDGSVICSCDELVEGFDMLLASMDEAVQYNEETSDDQ